MIFVHGVPVYWGIETEPADRSFVTRATLDEILPPFRWSNRAIRIRVSHKHWLHVGLFAYKTEVTPWGLEVLPEHIGEWGRRVPETDDTSEDPESLRPDAAGAGAVGDRDVDAADGGTAEGPDAQRDRPRLAVVRDGRPGGAVAPGGALPEDPV